VMSFSFLIFFFSSRRRHTVFSRDWSSDVCSSDLVQRELVVARGERLVEDCREIAAGADIGRGDDRVAVADLQRRVRLAAAGDDRSEERRVGEGGSRRMLCPNAMTNNVTD